MINRQGQKAGTQRGNRQRFPYEPRVVGGKLLMPAELQAIHRDLLPNLPSFIRRVCSGYALVWGVLRTQSV
jgi:hypothetical protein